MRRLQACLFTLLLIPWRLFPEAPLLGISPELSGSSPEEVRAVAARDARLKVIAAAGKYEGAPYLYGGIDARGFDCSGFIYRAFRDALSVSLPRSSGGLYSWAEKISDDERQAGDILFFKTASRGAVTHVGLYLGNGRFIHSASEGPRTGVIHSELSERYWSRTYAGAGRALPRGAELPRQDAGTSGSVLSPGTAPSPGLALSPGTALPPDTPGAEDAGSGGLYRLGIGLAPSWSGFLKNGMPLRGVAGQIRFAAETRSWKRPLLIGLELRPEWDMTLGIFRFPITLSIGFDDRFRIFAGPAFSFGDPALGERRYQDGSAWLGSVGIWAAPFSWDLKKGILSLYGELAWQAYFSDNPDRNWNADIGAGLRFSTGFCFTFTL